ncbi:HNH endonuclease [Pseudarthrobacter sulfonivorans]|uniref:HNH endonuclease n=1 Tax=Pseudarthrobacter sulfonivorans TaxID=121292 RepID=UPI0028607EA5|nr:HNH endonuclease [Pseudarthrobacter sulfonivorans]MDR6417577.1 hypothetical protein [Pseudarthrobacter sulfonivorans]
MDEPKPEFTTYDEVQQRILVVLMEAKSGHMSAAAALDKVRKQFSWSKLDLYPWSGEHAGLKLGVRVSRIRDHMVEIGLLARTDPMTWRITRAGAETARNYARQERASRFADEKPGEPVSVSAHSPGTNNPVAAVAEVEAPGPAASPEDAKDQLFRDPFDEVEIPSVLPKVKESVVAQKVTLRAVSMAFHPDEEFNRREQLWTALLASGGPEDVPRGRLRELNIYGNQAGIYVPSAETRTPDTPKGIALSFLHTGRHYDDELTETGVIYHYPTTGRSGHDESEIEASKAAYRAALPVFVIGPGTKATNRTVHRGYIEDVDDSNRVLLITFTRAPLPPPPPQDELVDRFDLTDTDPAPTFSARRNRPNQVRFAFDVYKRYGAECAVCGLNVKGLLQAAHLLSKKLGGSDDARNGLPLCANHHLAFDRGYWCIDTDLKLHAASEGPSLFDLGIHRSDLFHLPRAPHQEALSKVWTSWASKQPGTA